MLTKEIILKEIESGIKDYCKVSEFEIEYLENSNFYIYKDNTEFEFFIILNEEKDKFILSLIAMLNEANTINEQITLKTIESNKEIQEIIRELNLYLFIEIIFLIYLIHPRFR